MLDIKTLAAWGEFIGGIAVVVSLLYLASQIRQNSRLLRASAASTTAETQFGQMAMLVQDAEVARISREGIADLNSLSEADQARFHSLNVLQLRGHQQLFRLARDSALSPDSWEDQEQGMRWLVRQPGWQQWWAEWRILFGGDFSQYMEGFIGESETTE